MLPIYPFNDHLHNFAVWTAARATLRNFSTVKNIKTAIEKSELKYFTQNFPKDLSQDNFDLFHRTCATKLISDLKELTDKKVSYGRASKIIAIYLKTAVVLPENGKGKICEVVHPPIDRILLKRLYKETKDNYFKDINWTTMDFKDYWGLVSHIRSNYGFFNWKLETYWTPA